MKRAISLSSDSSPSSPSSPSSLPRLSEPEAKRVCRRLTFDDMPRPLLQVEEAEEKENVVEEEEEEEETIPWCPGSPGYEPKSPVYGLHDDEPVSDFFPHSPIWLDD